MTVEVGDAAPDFELRDQTGQPVRLSDYHGKKAVVLVFYPFTFTGLCQGELCSIRDEIDVFQNDDVQTLAVSVDSPAAHRVWAE
ncbi:MAG: redoxin domain-containing protein, partial [Actinobacteria bacterium]|nr:redoxin domain-containing protein [Actinomycetota bacterium]